MLDAVIADPFLDELNSAVQAVQRLPRVRFEVGLGEAAETWIKKKHANGAIHEPATLAALWAAHKTYPIRQFFDLGAQFGYFSLFALQAFDCEVTAFEMHPAALAPLAGNIAPHARIVHAVMGDEIKARQTFWISGFNIFEKPAGGWDELETIPGAMKERGANNKGRGFAKVGFATLDAYCIDNAAPDLIKIDVEGYQAKAIRGGLETFKSHKPVIIIELHDPEKLARFGETNASTVQPLFDMGYRAYFCGDHRSPEATFELVERMTEDHERLSIMVFAP